MPVQHAIWTVEASPHPLAGTRLASETILEDMIVAAPSMLSDEWLLIGRQERTSFGGRVDLVAIAPDGALVLIELKRDKTPREVAAQAIDYASWLETLEAGEIAAMYERFSGGKSLAADFKGRFGHELSDDDINLSHQIIVVASELDDSTERIINYLNARDIAINVLFFQVFEHSGTQLLSRTWLIDPVQTQENASAPPTRDAEPWNGEFYASFGEDNSRSWEEGRKFGFLAAGGGTWYSNSLRLLEQGDRIWLKAPGHGFVGVGRVLGPREPAITFEISTPEGPKLAMDVLQGGSYHREFLGDAEKQEYFVPVEWLRDVPLAEAVNEIGLFGNQNTVCRPLTPKWRHTVERLKKSFNI